MISPMSNAPWTATNAKTLDDQTGLEEVVGLNDLVNYLVAKLKVREQDVRTEKDRLRKAIQAGVRSQRLTSVGIRDFRFGDFVMWARGHQEFGPLVAAIPAPLVGVAGANPSPMTRFGQPHGVELPNTADEWRSSYLAAVGRIRELEARVERLQHRVAQLEPYKEKAEKQQADGRKYGQRGGRGRKLS